MTRTRIKICGVTRPADALLAAEAGADAIGMVFHAPARRNISSDVAREICRKLPPFVTPVGVFVDASAEHIRATARDLGLRTVQLNGDAPPPNIDQLPGLAVIRAVRAAEREIAKAHLARFSAIVLEPPRSDQPGGSGMANDWAAIHAMQRQRVFDGIPLIAAGGLTSETVGDVVSLIRPWAVDVSSGVEESVGVKSDEKVRAFIAAVRQADQSHPSR